MRLSSASLEYCILDSSGAIKLFNVQALVQKTLLRIFLFCSQDSLQETDTKEAFRGKGVYDIMEQNYDKPHPLHDLA